MNRRSFCCALLPVAAASSLEARELPRPSKELVIDLPGGKTLQLSSYKGKVLAVEFLLTTCPHCQKASQALEKVYKQLGPKGFQPVGIAINAGGDVAEFVKKFGLSYPVGSMDHKIALDYLQHPAFERLMMPQMAFVDRKFTVRSQYPGDSPFFSENEDQNVIKEVDPLLKEGAATAPPARRKAS